MMKKIVMMMTVAIMVGSMSGCALFDNEVAKIETEMAESMESLMEVQAVEAATQETQRDYHVQKPVVVGSNDKYVLAEVESVISTVESETEEGEDQASKEVTEEAKPENGEKTKEAKDDQAKKATENKSAQKKEKKGEESARQAQTVTQAETLQPVETAQPVVVEVVQPAQTESGHVHEWEETGRNSETNCYAALTTTTISYTCINCGETKIETTQEPSDCDWQWVGEWEYGYCNRCERWRNLYHQCVTHGTFTIEGPRREEEDNHVYTTYITEPSCEERGLIQTWCHVCNTHFKTDDVYITNETYPDGGGNGHVFVETSRRELDEEETWWYGEGKVEATFTCSVCGRSYNDIIDK